MKILVTGGTGTIGTALVSMLRKEHEVITVGRRSGDYQADMMDKGSIRRMFEEIGDLDGVISLTGGATIGPVWELSEDDFRMVLESKVLSQINLIREGMKHVRDGGFITLTSGMAGKLPIPGTALIAMANAALEAFVKALEAEETGNLRINVVSPAMVTESAALFGMDTARTVSAEDTARVYRKLLRDDRSFTISETLP